MTEKIKEVLRLREHLIDRVSQTEKLINRWKPPKATTPSSQGISAREGSTTTAT